MSDVEQETQTCTCGHPFMVHLAGGRCIADDCTCQNFDTNKSTTDEQVNHPSHYGGDTPYEAIKVIEAWGLGRGFCLGNAIKYVSRAGKKDSTKEIEDLKKAAWYLSRRIDQLEPNNDA